MIVLYIVQSAAWAIGGFVVGWLAGRLTRDVHRIATVSPDDPQSRREDHVDDDTPDTETSDAETSDAETPAAEDRSADAPTRRRWWRSSRRTDLILGLVVLLLGVATVVDGLVQSTATRRAVSCEQAYANAFADALDARTTANNNAQSAMDQLVSAIGAVMNGPPSVAHAAAVQAAIRDYLAKRATAQAQQRAHPYPPAPRDLCPP